MNFLIKGSHWALVKNEITRSKWKLSWLLVCFGTRWKLISSILTYSSTQDGRISFIPFRRIDQGLQFFGAFLFLVYQREYHRTYRFHKSWEIFEEADGRNWMKKDWRRKGRRIKRGGKEIGAANKVTLKEGEARFKEGCKGTKVEQIPRGGAAKLCRVTAFWKEEAQRDRRKIWGNAVLKRSYDCSFLPSFLPSRFEIVEK